VRPVAPPIQARVFPAMGGNNPWIVNGLTNGTTYYFCARGVAGSSTGPWSAPSSGITIGAPSGGNAVSGKVTFSETAKGPLYVGFYNQSTGASTPMWWEARLARRQARHRIRSAFPLAPITTSSASSTRATPASSVVRDKSPIQTGITTRRYPSPHHDQRKPDLAQRQQHRLRDDADQEQISPGGTNTNYTIGFNVNGLLKLPVGVELATGPNPEQSSPPTLLMAALAATLTSSATGPALMAPHRTSAIPIL